MKIFLWGCYWQGNFGDDLMAVVMSRYFLDQGHEVRAFRLPPLLAKKYGIETCSDVIEGVAWADSVVLGGGAFLQRKFSLILKLMSPAIRDIYKELENLYGALERSNKDFVFCSIGSSGAKAFKDLDAVVRNIMSLPSNRGGSVRLAKDLSLFKAGTKYSVEFYPDILLASYSYIDVKERRALPGRKLRVGVNVSKRDKGFVSEILKWGDKNADKVELCFILTHSIESGICSEYTSAHEDVCTVVHRDPYEFAFDLLDFDCIISIKLHLGLVALAGGALFISYKGQPKTIDQLTDLGLASCVFSRTNIHGLLGALDNFIFDQTARKELSLDKISDVKMQALTHLSFIEKLLVR